jgi:hypothetical protein
VDAEGKNSFENLLVILDEIQRSRFNTSQEREQTEACGLKDIRHSLIPEYRGFVLVSERIFIQGNRSIMCWANGQERRIVVARRTKAELKLLKRSFLSGLKQHDQSTLQQTKSNQAIRKRGFDFSCGWLLEEVE